MYGFSEHIILRLDLIQILSMMNQHPRILTLDGGGVRGLSSLLILNDIMEDIAEKTQTSKTPKPSEYFDLIGGTGTGGLIAIMLGVLRMVSFPF
jgi:patatin-like phospholipase/acyl hydrolase